VDWANFVKKFVFLNLSEKNAKKYDKTLIFNIDLNHHKHLYIKDLLNFTKNV